MFAQREKEEFGIILMGFYKGKCTFRQILSWRIVPKVVLITVKHLPKRKKTSERATYKSSFFSKQGQSKP